MINQKAEEYSMRIINLVENENGAAGCEAAHGLSFYVETPNHKILIDAGPSDVILRNAKVLEVDLTAVDTMILSHGHYDHSGGLLAFAQLNPKAKIYMQREATGEHYAFDNITEDLKKNISLYRYIGIDKQVSSLPQIVFLDGDLKIDNELLLFTVQKRNYELSSTNKRILIKKGDSYVQDNFEHEQYLVISCDNQSVLFSGCAHNGILNIMDEFHRKYNFFPSAAVSGFHLMKKSGYQEADREEERKIARKLTSYPTKFFTCHCTGIEPFDEMRSIMKNQLEYIKTGTIFDL